MESQNPLKQYILEFDNHLKIQLTKQDKISNLLLIISICGFIEWIISGFVLFFVIAKSITTCWLLFSLIFSFGIIQLTLYLYRILFVKYRIFLYIHYFLHLILIGSCIWNYLISFKKLFVRPFYPFIIVSILMLIKFIVTSVILILSRKYEQNYERICRLNEKIKSNQDLVRKNQGTKKKKRPTIGTENILYNNKNEESDTFELHTEKGEKVEFNL